MPSHRAFPSAYPFGEQGTHQPLVGVRLIRKGWEMVLFVGDLRKRSHRTH